MTDKTINIIHRFIVPIIHTVIWAIGLFSCFQLLFNQWTLFDDVPDGHAFLGVITIYVVYLMEIFLNLLDTALINKDEKFKANLLCLIAWFIMNIGATFCLSISFISYSINKDGAANDILLTIVLMAILLKLSELLFDRNQSFFMHKMSKCSIKSRAL